MTKPEMGRALEPGHFTMKKNQIEYEIVKEQVLKNKGRFLSRLSRNLSQVGDCLVWTGATQKNGYGRMNFRWRGKHVQLMVHRVFGVMFDHGPIPDGYHVDHCCFNILCVKHLEVVPYQENLKRRDDRRKNGN